jgi:hypothetical protein
MLRELFRGIVAAAGWLIVSAVVVVLLAYVVSSIW